MGTVQEVCDMYQNQVQYVSRYCERNNYRYSIRTGEIVSGEIGKPTHANIIENSCCHVSTTCCVASGKVACCIGKPYVGLYKLLHRLFVYTSRQTVQIVWQML